MKPEEKRISAQSPLSPEWLSDFQIVSDHQSGRLEGLAGSDSCFS